MSFDRSCIFPFRLAEDPGFLYVMIDAGIVQEAAQGLTNPQKAALNAFRWTPTEAQLPYVPQWAGNDPAAVYFRATDAQIKNALKRRYRAPSAGETEDDIPTVGAAS